MLKATGGLGGLFCGMGLAYIGFPEKATREMLTPEIIDGLFFMCGPLYWILVAVGMGIMAMHNLNETRHGEIMNELKERRAAQQGELPSATA